MINQVMLVGRLTRDPELKRTMDGKAVLNVTIALNRHYRNNFGEFETDFVQCTLWNRSAENTAKYCSKGTVIGVVGHIQTRNYENQEGRKIYVTEVVAESVKFLGGKPSESREFQSVKE